MGEHCSRSALWLAVALLGACGDNPINPMVDAPKSQPCWTDTHTPNGTIQLGTGDPFTPMPDNLPTEYGSQNGFDMPVNARITGLMPGNPANVLDPSNPRTRFLGFFVDTGDAVAQGLCGSRVAYQPSVPGADDLSHHSAIEFDVNLPQSQIFGRQVRIVVEIIDSAGNYATDEKVVTCLAPPGWPT